MRERIKKFFLKIYRTFLVRKIFYKAHERLFLLSLCGLGILNHESMKASGEYYFLNKILRKFFKNENILVFDVGGYKGDYAKVVRNFYPQAKIFSFEPHPFSYSKLKKRANRHGFKAYNFGFADREKEVFLYDRRDKKSSCYASIYQEAIEVLLNKKFAKYKIRLITIDKFTAQKSIGRINLLKIDAEGSEFLVLKGAKNLINNNLIDIIHFELNEMNVFSRIFLKDFLEILPFYTFYRLLPKGMVKLDNYNPIFYEIFGFQNIVAIRNDLL